VLCVGTWQTLAEKYKVQELSAPFQVSERKHAEHILLYHLPKIQKSPALFSTLFCMHLCIKGTEELFTNTHPTPSVRREILRQAGFPEITPILKIELQLQSNSSLVSAPLHLPEGRTCHGWGLCESTPCAAGRSSSRLCKDRIFPSNITRARAS